MSSRKHSNRPSPSRGKAKALSKPSGTSVKSSSTSLTQLTTFVTSSRSSYSTLSTTDATDRKMTVSGSTRKSSGAVTHSKRSLSNFTQMSINTPSDVALTGSTKESFVHLKRPSSRSNTTTDNQYAQPASRSHRNITIRASQTASKPFPARAPFQTKSSSISPIAIKPEVFRSVNHQTSPYTSRSQTRPLSSMASVSMSSALSTSSSVSSSPLKKQQDYLQQFKKITSRFFSATATASNDGDDAAATTATSSHPASQGELQQLIQNWAELNYKGMEYLKVGNPSDLVNAEQCFTKGAKMMGPYSMMPFRSLSLANLASCKLRQGHYDDAIKLFQPLLTQLPVYQQVAISQIATIHMELASAYELSGRHDLAIKELYAASSRFVHAASHYLAAIQESDAITASPKKAGQQGTTLRADERVNHISTAIECWRTALGCRYSAVVLQHKSGEFDLALEQLHNIIKVYDYYLKCADTVIEARKTSENKLTGESIIKLYPECPPEAVVVTKDLVNTFPDLQDDYLAELLKITGTDTCSVYHSLASVYIDSGKIHDACEAFKKSVELVLKYNTDAFMTVASEGSKSLRLLYEKLLHEHSTFDPKTSTSVKLSDHFTLPIDNKQQLETLIQTINQARVVIFGHFNTYVTTTMLHPQLSPTTDVAEGDGKISEDSMKKINEATLKMRERIKSGQFYEDMRETYQQELGEQFDENNPDLVAIRPHGYVPVHERGTKKD